MFSDLFSELCIELKSELLANFAYYYQCPIYNHKYMVQAQWNINI